MGASDSPRALSDDYAQRAALAGDHSYHAHWHPQTTCEALEIEDYTLRDARHSWAVRGRKRGGSLEEIASQLGHKNIYMAATVYGVFKPTIEERKASNLRIAK